MSHRFPRPLFARLLACSTLLLVATALPARGWSIKEHIIMTRLAAELMSGLARHWRVEVARLPRDRGSWPGTGYWMR